MFNEMYGWDSYFIIRGLLGSGDEALARGMVENFFFEIEHYGGILNANRTYYLTRSQPPFLTSMIRAVYDAEKAEGHADRAGLERAYAYAVRDYRFWTSAPHLAGSTGLSRYYDFGEGPVPELGTQADSYYRRVAGYFLIHPGEAGSILVEGASGLTPPSAIGPAYSVLVCNGSHPSSEPEIPPSAGCDQLESMRLSREFYRGDVVGFGWTNGVFLTLLHDLPHPK